ncbi:MAG: CidA/LrgA family protein [Gammaproteobacteria bacterium]|nr:CidA/LrgA family protein [Gammaproteobacteria bacterium]
MLHSVLVLIAFQLLGEFVQATFDLPIHGAICGMLMLLVVLIIRGRVSAPLRTTANSLFQYLPLILIPPSVGVMTQWKALTAQPIALGAVIVLSTAIGLAVTAFLFQRLAGRGTKS